MKRNNFFSCSILSLVLIFSGCQTEIIERPIEPDLIEGEGIKINKEQRVLDLTSVDVIEVIPIDTVRHNDYDFPVYEIEVEGTTAEIDQIESGTVIYAPTGNKGGMVLFVYEVEKVENEGGRINGLGAVLVKGIQTTLDMYFNYEHAKLLFTTPENRAKRNSVIDNKMTSNPISWREDEVTFNPKMGGVSFVSSPEKLFQANLASTLWSSGDSYVKVNGSLSIHPALDVFLEYEPIKVEPSSKLGGEVLEWLEAGLVSDLILAQYKDKNYYLGNMKQLRVNAYMDIDRTLTFNIHMGKEFPQPKKILLGTLIVPSVPVSLQLEMWFEIDFSVLGELDVEVYAIKENDVVIGVNLDRDLPAPVWYYEFDSREESGYKLKAEIELTAGIKLILESEVYVLGVIGPEISAEAFLEATATVNAITGTDDPSAVNWNLSSDAGLRGRATLNLSAFHIDPATWKFWVMAEKEIKKNVYSAPHHLNIEQGDEQTGTLGQVLQTPITVGAYDSRDKLITYLPVPVYFEAQQGKTDPSGFVMTSEGLANTHWTLGSENDTQKLDAYLKDIDGNKIENGGVEIYATAEDPFEDTSGTFIDSRDGQEYKWVRIGEQIWMAENLKATKYSDNTSIPLITDNSTWGNLTSPAYCWNFNDSVSYASPYGALYNWYTIEIGNLCPNGWHVPTDEEWTSLTDYLGGEAVAGGKLKETGIAHWFSPNTGANNETGFTALPGGSRSIHGYFANIGHVGRWWCATEYDIDLAENRDIFYNHSNIFVGPSGKRNGFSVRCIRD